MPEAVKRGFELTAGVMATLLVVFLGIPKYVDSEIDSFEVKLNQELKSLITQNSLNVTDVSRRLQNVETTQKTSVPYIEKYIETDLAIQKHLEFSKGKVAELETKIKHTDDKLTTKVDTCAQRKRHLIDNLREKYDDAFKNLNEKVDNRHNNIISILNKKTEDRFTGKDGTQLTEDLVTIKEQLKEELGLVKDRLKRLEHYVYNLPHTDEDD